MGQRVVVCSSGGNEDPWLLPASTPTDRTWIHGGERAMYEFATAVAAAGYEVEIRGEVHAAILEQMTDATRTSVISTGLAPRRPTHDDIVVVPEGWTDPMHFLRVVLSPARAIMLVLAPPGIMGWDFTDAWAPPHFDSVAREQLLRPATFAAIRAMGLEMLTNARALSEVARVGGVECTLIGHGSPTPWPDPAPEKTHDIAILGDNRWADSARTAVEAMPGASVLSIPRAPHAEVLQAMSRARVFAWVGRAEGDPRPLIEARAMGTVPVAFRTPLIEGLDEEHGGVGVDELDELPEAITTLLSDPARLTTLCRRATATSWASTAWEPYVQRVSDALAAEPADPAAGARAAAGAALDAQLGGASIDELADGSELRRAYAALRRRSVATRNAMADRVAEAGIALDRSRGELTETGRALGREISERDRQLEQLKATRTFRYTAALRNPYGWLRERREMNDE